MSMEAISASKACFNMVWPWLICSFSYQCDNKTSSRCFLQVLKGHASADYIVMNESQRHIEIGYQLKALARRRTTSIRLLITLEKPVRVSGGCRRCHGPIHGSQIFSTSGLPLDYLIGPILQTPWTKYQDPIASSLKPISLRAQSTSVLSDAYSSNGDYALFEELGGQNGRVPQPGCTSDPSTENLKAHRHLPCACSPVQRLHKVSGWVGSPQSGLGMRPPCRPATPQGRRGGDLRFWCQRLICQVR